MAYEELSKLIVAKSYIQHAKQIYSSRNPREIYRVTDRLLSNYLKNRAAEDAFKCFNCFPVDHLVNYVLLHAAMAGEI